MTLATKNGSLIVKDGKIAENCGCCGGWYCYGGCGCSDQRPSALSASLSFSMSQTAYGQMETVAFGGGGMHQCAKYTSSSFSDVSKTVSLSYTGTSQDGASCYYETPITGEYSFTSGAPVPVGFVYMRAVIECTSTGTSLSITNLNYSARPFRGLNQVFVPNNTFYAIKAPCEPESYSDSIHAVGLNAAFVSSPDGRSERQRVFSPPCPNKTPTSSPTVKTDFTCSAFGQFQYELVQWTPVSSDLNSTVVSPATVGTLTVTV
jgi:hypothetical protein